MEDGWHTRQSGCIRSQTRKQLVPFDESGLGCTEEITRYKDELDSIEVPLVLADPIKGKVPGCFNNKCVYS